MRFYKACGVDIPKLSQSHVIFPVNDDKITMAISGLLNKPCWSVGTSLTMPFADPNKRIQKVKTWKKNNPVKVKAHRKRWRKRRTKKKTNDLKMLIEMVESKKMKIALQRLRRKTEMEKLKRKEARKNDKKRNEESYEKQKEKDRERRKRWYGKLKQNAERYQQYLEKKREYRR